MSDWNHDVHISKYVRYTTRISLVRVVQLVDNYSQLNLLRLGRDQDELPCVYLSLAEKYPCILLLWF